MKYISSFYKFINEIKSDDIQNIDNFADQKLNPLDIDITGKHFFDRLNDLRNKKPITTAELIGFFKRLSKKKSEFIKFLKKYDQIVAKDNRTNINIPFMKFANKAIAKTIMRNSDFKTSSPILQFENLSESLISEIMEIIKTEESCKNYNNK